MAVSSYFTRHHGDSVTMRGWVGDVYISYLMAMLRSRLCAFVRTVQCIVLRCVVCTSLHHAGAGAAGTSSPNTSR